MRKRLLLMLAAGSLALGSTTLVACDNQSDGDGDADADGDADTDADGDADTDADPCGDGTCASTETPRNCPADCPAVCGDGDCTHTENATTCAEDCGTGDCDVVAGTGCGPDEKCGLYTDETRWDAGCVPLTAADAVGPGEVCMSLEDTYFGFYDNCVAGYWCLRRAGSEDYRCEKLCTESDRSACGSAYPDEGGDLTVDGLCIYSLGPEMPVVGLMACAVAAGCSPTCQDCPGGGPGGTVGCYPATDSINIGTICASFTRDDEAPGFTGDVCTSLNHCSPGYTCLAATGGGRECRPFCDPNATYPAGDGDADADADAGDADADADADADSDAGPICPFVFCEDRVGEGAGTCQIPAGTPPEMFSAGIGVGACLE